MFIKYDEKRLHIPLSNVFPLSLYCYFFLTTLANLPISGFSLWKSTHNCVYIYLLFIVTYNYLCCILYHKYNQTYRQLASISISCKNIDTSSAYRYLVSCEISRIAIAANSTQWSTVNTCRDMLTWTRRAASHLQFQLAEDEFRLWIIVAVRVVSFIRPFVTTYREETVSIKYLAEQNVGDIESSSVRSSHNDH